MKVRWGKQASGKLVALFNYIKKESLQNAHMVFDKIDELAESLIIFPEKYPVEPAVNNPKVRFAVLWNIKLVYAISKNSITIIRVFSVKQNLKKLKF